MSKKPTEEETARKDESHPPRTRSPVMGLTGLQQQQQEKGKKSPEGRRDHTIGILRLDFGKPRRSSGSSVEFRSPPERLASILVEPPSPQPSVDRLSVSFAPEEKSMCSVFTPGSPPVAAMEKVRFPRENTVTDGEDEQEDYSASVNAIIQRRFSTKRQSRRRRRPSSPFSPDADSGQSGGRRPSVFTNSSGDTAISIDEGVTQEQIYENLRLHKEVLSSVKHQPWGMRRKLRLVQQAKAYVKKHEGELKERLAQSKTTRDIMSRFNILLVKRWQYMRRELANLVNVLIPWELRIKEIESHFGSVVASYFTFLRWLFWVNLVIAVLLAAFVAIPEMLTADPMSAGERKVLPPGEEEKSTKLSTIWNFEGILKYSPIFYGYYTNRDGTEKGYRLPFAYFMTGLAVYVYSFVATLRRMAENSRMSKLSEKDDECIFTWKLFTGWDYMIGNAETAHNRVASIILGFKEALLEEAERKRDARNWRVIGCRVLVNLSVLVLLASSAYAVVLVVNRSTEDGANDTWWRQNEITVVLSLISFVFPIIFELLGLMESYHPRKQLRIQLARIMVLNLLNLYTLIFALFGKISQMTIELQKLKPNTTTTVAPTTIRTSSSSNFSDITTSSSIFHSIPSVECYEIEVPCTSLTATTTTVTTDVTTSALAAAFLMAKIASTSLAPYLMGNFSTLTENTFPGENMTMDYSTFANNLTTNLVFLNNSPSTSSSFDYANDTFSNWTEVETYFNSTEFFSELTNFSMTSGNDSLCSKEEFSSSTSDCEATFYDATTNVSSSFTDQENVTKYLDNKTVKESGHENVSHTTEDSVIRSSLLSILVTALSTMNDSSSASSTEVYTSTEEASTTPLASSEWDDFYLSTSSTTVEEADKMCFKKVCPPVPETTSVPFSSSTGSQEELLSGPMCPSARIDVASGLDDETRRKLGQLCWETMFGQELVKLTVMDLVITIVSTLVIDFIRAIFVRVMNHCWCWDLEKQFPQYGDFKIAENILHLVNNQGMVWMGMFFSPGLPLLNLVKLTILMYLRSWAVLTCNVPHEVVFRASRSNNFYLALLLTMLFLCVLPVGYAIVWVAPSWHCGPFANYERIYHLFTHSLYKVLPQSLHRALDYIASPGIVIPLLVLLILIIYYLLSLAGALREANNDLKIQLRRERTEERRKMFQLVDRRRRADSADTPFSRWRKILPVMPSSKPGSQIEERTTGASNGGQGLGNSSTSKTDANRAEMLAKLVKRALRKSSATSDEESALVGLDGDGSSDAQHQEDRPREKPKSHKQRVRGGGNSTTTTTTTTNNKSSDRSSESKLRSVVRSPSTSSYREREDSLVSGWSDTIPVIRISPTDGSDSNAQKAEPQQPVATKTTDEDEAVAPVHERKRVARVLLEGASRSDSQGELLDMMELPAKDTPQRRKREVGQPEVSASIAKPESDEETSSTNKSNVL